jgi:hypothetical protein
LECSPREQRSAGLDALSCARFDGELARTPRFLSPWGMIGYVILMADTIAESFWLLSSYARRAVPSFEKCSIP